MELSRHDLRDISDQDGLTKPGLVSSRRVISEQASLSLTIRFYKSTDYPHLDKWMEDLARFYDGHSAKHKLIDQLVGREQGDKTGFFTKNKLMFMCDSDGMPAGMLCINNKRGGASKIGPVIVNPEMRGRGIGKKLLETAETFARENGARKLYATTSHLNTSMNAIFRKYGFQVEARFPDQYKQGSEELIWGLHLVDVNGINIGDIASVMLQNDIGGRRDIQVRLFTPDSLDLVRVVNGLYQQWHDDLGEDFIEGMLAGHERAVNGALSFQDKSKYVLVAHGYGYEGVLTFTPKRGGPVKVYPVAGTPAAQRELFDRSEQMAREAGSHKLYTFAHVRDTSQLALLNRIGFVERGVLQSPYKAGHDLVALDKFVK
jgi:ribosomal protein S18 acetylase RimI-like enzyme